MSPDLFKQAIVEHKALRILHQKDGDDEPTVRRVLPYWLTQGRLGMYVHGYCALRRARRSFRLDRITEATVGEQVVPERMYDKLAVEGLAAQPMGVVVGYK